MLRALGYAGFGSDKLDDWRQFGTSLLGFQAVERGNSLLAFRMDDRKQRVVIDRAMGDGARFFGWEVADAAALDALAARLESAGVAVTAEPKALADARRVAGADLLRTTRSATGSKPSTAPRSTTRRSARAARSPASAPGRSASATSC